MAPSVICSGSRSSVSDANSVFFLAEPPVGFLVGAPPLASGTTSLPLAAAAAKPFALSVAAFCAAN